MHILFNNLWAWRSTHNCATCSLDQCGWQCSSIFTISKSISEAPQKWNLHLDGGTLMGDRIFNDPSQQSREESVKYLCTKLDFRQFEQGPLQQRKTWCSSSRLRNFGQWVQLTCKGILATLLLLVKVQSASHLLCSWPEVRVLHIHAKGMQPKRRRKGWCIQTATPGWLPSTSVLRQHIGKNHWLSVPSSVSPKMWEYRQCVYILMLNVRKWWKDACPIQPEPRLLLSRLYHTLAKEFICWTVRIFCKRIPFPRRYMRCSANQ